MKMLLINVIDNEVKPVNADGLEDYYSLIGCKTVDIVSRTIGGKYFDIICDEEGLFVEKPKISAVDDFGNIMLVGNLLISGSADDEGNLTSLSDSDIVFIKNYIRYITTRVYPDKYCALVGLNY